MIPTFVPALIPYLLISAGLTGALALFWTLKREMRLAAARHRRRVDEIAERIERTSAQPAPEPVYIPAAPRAALNVSKRVQAMRMFRRNEDVGRIAEVLGVTRREVELLIRVHHIKPNIPGAV